MQTIEVLLEHDTAGDPITGLRWTRKTPDNIAQLLQQTGIPISTNTVARLLHGMNYSLHLNRKQLATGSSPDRDQQFQRRHQEAGTGRQSQKLRRQVGPLAGPGE